jgi:hypothetical protein
MTEGSTEKEVKPYFGSDWRPRSEARMPELKIMATNELRKHAFIARKTARLFDEEIHRRGLSAEIDDE